MEFRGWPKIPRLNRDMIITEKIDGTNAQIFIDHAANYEDLPAREEPYIFIDGFVMLAGSRKRWLCKDKDNFGFWKWVNDNAEELLGLGPGRHFGEWWGQSIQRNYGLKERRFSLFNTSLWAEKKPDCCHVVPVLWEGEFHTADIDYTLFMLEDSGSQAASGFMGPEGIVVFHTASNASYKVTIKDDDKPKMLTKSNNNS